MRKATKSSLYQVGLGASVLSIGANVVQGAINADLRAQLTEMTVQRNGWYLAAVERERVAIAQTARAKAAEARERAVRNDLMNRTRELQAAQAQSDARRVENNTLRAQLVERDAALARVAQLEAQLAARREG